MISSAQKTPWSRDKFPVELDNMFPLLNKMPSLPLLPRNHQRLKVVLVQANLLVTINLLSKESYCMSMCTSASKVCSFFHAYKHALLYFCSVGVVSKCLCGLDVAVFFVQMSRSAYWASWIWRCVELASAEPQVSIGQRALSHGDTPDVWRHRKILHYSSIH